MSLYAQEEWKRQAKRWHHWSTKQQYLNRYQAIVWLIDQGADCSLKDLKVSALSFMMKHTKIILTIVLNGKAIVWLINQGADCSLKDFES